MDNSNQGTRVSSRLVDTIRRGDYVITTKNAPEEDWRTAIAHNIEPIPKDTCVIVEDVVNQNFYGTYIRVRYNNRIYDIDPNNLRKATISDIEK